ncbi:hypothetical protein IAT40_007900 [Kwoniella sp. CBS 6097]
MSADEAASPPVDASAPAPASDSPAAGAEKEAPKSTSSATKKAAPASKAKGRPSVGGGNKKGQAAAAAAANENRSYSVGDIVLARLRGYPPWPARIVEPETVPRNVLNQRPGKNPSIYCCQFFPAGDYSWLQSKEIKPLTSSDISTWLSEPHRKATGGLRDAYQTAQDPTEWDEEQAEIHRANEEAENAVDELDDEEEEEEAVSGGKRKRGAAEKKADKKKKAKTAPKNKADVDEVESEAEAPKSKAKSKPAAKPKAEKAKPTKAAAKPDNQEPVDEDPLASNPECVKVKDWRHKLQRAFLSKSLPTADEMPTYDELFKTIESYNAMTIDALQYSKIGKVMKKIVTLSEIPRNEEFKITDRASKLMHQWTDFIASSESKPNGSASATEAAANGNGNGNGDAEKKEEKASESAPAAEEKKDEAEAEAAPEKKEDEVAAAAEEKKDEEAPKEAAAETGKKEDDGNMDVDA